MAEVRQQPNWRRQSDKACEYYDGNQFDAETMARFEELGLGAVYENLIKQPINLMLGMEAKSRTDWKVSADSDDFTDVAEALSQKLHEAERESRADRACADAYAPQIKAGIGFVEVSRESNPFKYPYRVTNVHRNELSWDWTSKDPDLGDAKYMIRRRWMPSKQAAKFFPQHAHLINSAATGDLASTFDFTLNSDSQNLLSRAFDQEQRTTIETYEWRDTVNRRCCLFEVWYKIWVTNVVMRLPDGRTIEADMKNGKHVQLIASGQVKAFKAHYPKMRMSWWIGCHRLYDGETPYKHNHFPYVPFFGFREDLTGVPYGMIRDLIPLQDEVNARRVKMMSLLSSKRIIRTKGAVENVDIMLDEVARPDADIELNAEAMHAGGVFKVETDDKLSAQQFQVMNDTRESFQRVSGVFAPAYGENQGSQSGLAINSLVEQSSTTLAEINDNFRFSRRKVGELLMELVREDLGSGPAIVMVGDDKKKAVKLNQRVVDANGIPSLINDTSSALVKVTLDDVASSPAYRMQQQQFFTDAMKSAPPQVQAVLLPYYFDVSELPNRKEIVKQIRVILGVPDPKSEQDPEIMKYQQAIQQLQQQLIAMNAALEDKQADRDNKLQQVELRNKGMLDLQDAKNNEVVEQAEAEVQAQKDKIKFLSDFIDSIVDENEQQAEVSSAVKNQAYLLNAEE